MMMKVSTTNNNGSNTFAKNLLAPISFYLKADDSSGSDDEKCSECDHDVMVHKVCYDPMNMDYNVQNLAEHAKKYKEMKTKKAPTCDEINEMVAESVKKSVKEMFETHVKTLKKRSREDTNSDSDSENEHYHMEDVSLDLKEVNVSETFALSDLCRPPQKHQKTNHLTPVTVALINAWL